MEAEDINERSVRLHRLNKLRMAEFGVCRYGCPICRLVRKGEIRPRKQGLKAKRSWKNNNVDSQYDNGYTG